ncbi:MAG: hypothetical protein AB7V56_14345 [Candidatus Nitrosocosmicus sp.]
MSTDSKNIVPCIFLIAFIVIGCISPIPSGLDPISSTYYKSYAQQVVEFPSFSNLIVKLDNAKFNPLSPQTLEYRPTSITTNATDLQGIEISKSTSSWVSVTDNDVFLSTVFKTPLLTNQSKLSVIDYSSFFDVKAVEERENGSKVFKLDRTAETDDIMDHRIINGTLTQTGNKEAILILYLFP